MRAVGEGNLDARMISSFGLNVTTLVTNTNTSMSTEEGEGFGLAMLDFVTSLASRAKLPVSPITLVGSGRESRFEAVKPRALGPQQVLSLSLGSLSAYSCDLLCKEAVQEHGQDLAECKAFMQKQRQVCMFEDTAQISRINVVRLTSPHIYPGRPFSLGGRGRGDSEQSDADSTNLDLRTFC